jgi:hypothetical protein
MHYILPYAVNSNNHRRAQNVLAKKKKKINISAELLICERMQYVP